MNDKLHMKNFDFGFILWDENKWFEISYTYEGNTTRVTYGLYVDNDQKGEYSELLEYNTSTAIYYEFEPSKPRRLLRRAQSN